MPEISAGPTIEKCLATLAQSGELKAALDGVLEDVVNGWQIDRGLIWQIVVTDLTVTNEYATDGSANVMQASINCMESTRLVLGFLSEQDATIEIHDFTPSRGSWDDWNPFATYCESYSSTMLVPLRARGILAGFLSFQCRNRREWTVEERSVASKVGQAIAVLLSYEFEIERLKGKTAPNASQ